MRMVCARTHRDSTDKWMWDKKVANKIECRRGCRRAGLIRPVHQSGYGAKSACKHVGIPQHGDSDLVSSCEFSCDTDNGFKEIDEKFMLLHCDKNGEFADFPLNFHCEQGFLAI
ncbi:hypothetical protein MHBO_000047 [Bonamia ostreae]|uniref:Uncharacterized protein n=1 Tax=Bonamia ostreae TaxID=126728 RepID=A0ABV2AE59_9EUKA